MADNAPAHLPTAGSNDPHQRKNSASNRESRSVSDLIALLGILILGVLIVWGLIHAVQLSTPWFTSLFSSSRSTSGLVVEAQEHVTSGEPLTVSWNYGAGAEGYYAFLYSCQSGLMYRAAAAGGVGEVNIPCGAAFTTPSGKNTMTVTPVLVGSSATKSTISIVFIPAADTNTRVQGSTSVTVDPATGAAKPAQEPAQTVQTPSAPVVSTPAGLPSSTGSGLADLSVKIVAIGIIDPATGQFVNRLPSSPSDMAAVEFDISNVGTGASGTYYFSAHLPTEAGYTYTSPDQASLQPGAHILNTLRFTDIAPQGGIVSIQVDPNNAIHESAEGNNYASQAVGTMTGYYPQYRY